MYCEFYCILYGQYYAVPPTINAEEPYALLNRLRSATGRQSDGLAFLYLLEWATHRQTGVHSYLRVLVNSP